MVERFLYSVHGFSIHLFTDARVYNVVMEKQEKAKLQKAWLESAIAQKLLRKFMKQI